MSESRGASSHRYSRGAWDKGQFSGALVSPAADNPLGKIAAAEDPSAERGEGSVARSTHDNLRRALSKDAGVSSIWVGVFVPGTWYPHHPPVLVVIELELHQNSKAMEPETKGYNTYV